MTRQLLSTFAVALALVACGSGSGASSAHPTLRLATQLPAGPAATASGAATGATGAAGSTDGPPGLAGASAAPSALPYPDAPERTLLAHLKPELGPTCARSGPFYPAELGSVSCGDGTSIPYVDYSLFGTSADADAAFDADVQGAPVAPARTGTCSDGQFTGRYSLRGVTAGRIWCTARTDQSGVSHPVIEWTRESLRTIAVITGTGQTWTQLLAFWTTTAGPFE